MLGYAIKSGKLGTDLFFFIVGISSLLMIPLLLFKRARNRK